MALDQTGEGCLESRTIQRAAEADRHRQVIGRTLRVELPEEPHAPLGIGKLVAILADDAIGNGKQENSTPSSRRPSRNRGRLSCGSSMKRRASFKAISAFISNHPYEGR